MSPPVTRGQRRPRAAEAARPGGEVCRFCAAELGVSLIDLGELPLANSYLRPEDLERPEPRYALEPRVCERCWLVQIPELERAEELFRDYAYFASYSDSWLAHCERYCRSAIDRFGLGPESRVVEAASNDGYLLQFFAREGIRVLGVEPAENVAAAAEAKGIPTRREFFGEASARRLAASGESADLFIANNVLAHVPDLNDFVRGIHAVLAPGGAATAEVPHLLRLLEQGQLDTIYHEHFSYFSLGTLVRVFAAHGLEVFDVEELPTHGGSLRIYARRAEGVASRAAARVAEVQRREAHAGLEDPAAYRAFAARAERVRDDLLEFLRRARAEGALVAGYGAPAKGNTLLCWSGIGPDLLPFTVDRSPHKQGLYLPGSRIPVRAPPDLVAARPDFVLILPWNLRDEIAEQMRGVREWGGRFVVAVPRLEIVDPPP
ncbi:MAG TPA: class I SAM-dependent methyltransferase [Thermoanaerobaculia bacterium]|nr:class I SAM-dependent methyltransferase [Thermoanaerobaculia bacterium]